MPPIDTIGQPVLTTSTASGTSQTVIVITSKVHRAGTTTTNTEGLSTDKSDLSDPLILDNNASQLTEQDVSVTRADSTLIIDEGPTPSMSSTIEANNNIDPKDTSASLNLKIVPRLTADEIVKIVKRQSRICLTSSMAKPNKQDTGTVATDQYNHILNNQPKVCITHCKVPSSTNTDKKQKSTKSGVKRKSIADVFPSKDSAKHFKFGISQHILKRKYKHKYYFKCAVQDCNQKFKSVCKWNKHHKTKHSDVKYTCSTCNKVIFTPCSIKDHKYTHYPKLIFVADAIRDS